MNYIGRFGLEFNPFLKTARHETVIETTEYKEVNYRLDLLLKTRGFGLITGTAGKGKTTIVRSWANALNPSLYKVVYITLSTVTTNDFYRHLAEQLGLAPRYRKADNFRIIQDEITRYAVEKRIVPVIILDEANYIKTEILNDLKMIFNFEMDSKDRAVVLLCGLPALNNTLRLVAHEPLRQRITMNYHMEGMSKEESKNYIKEKLSKCKANLGVFADTALEAIVNTEGGVPRLINKLCDACLIIGHSQGVDEINSDIVMLAISETELG